MLAARGGDREAYARIVSRHYPAIVRFAQRFHARVDRDTAEDIAQDVFLKAWKAAPRYEPRAALATWLLRLAVNTCLNWRRAGRLRQALSLSGEAAPDVAAADVEPTPEADARDRADPVREAITALPITQRAAIVLRHYHELSYAEIGEILDISVPAVESVLFRARRRLRTQLAPVFDRSRPQDTAGSRAQPLRRA